MINEVYLELINPINLITNFKTQDEFKDWLDLGSKEDLKHTLKAFEECELYEHCQIIKNKIVNI
jgi:hypothetical protein